jgi:holo-[acyl-carrier protein] synthase
MIVGIGIDIVEIPRFSRVLERQKDRFTGRVFTEREQEYCREHRDPVPHYAARFAAKEALFKALSTGWAKGVSWLDVEVRREGFGAPAMILRGEAAKICANLGVDRVHLSLSHTEASAIALVVLES